MAKTDKLAEISEKSNTRIKETTGRIAFKSAANRRMSTIDISSMMTQSASSGLCSLRSNRACTKPPSSGLPFTSSSRWIVFASYPVASLMRLAARPVGAAHTTFSPACA